MSLEEMKNEQGMERTPIEGNNENVDAEGNPRSLQKMPDGTVQMVSQKEYAQAIDSYQENMK